MSPADPQGKPIDPEDIKRCVDAHVRIRLGADGNWKAQYEEEYATVDRVWKALGISNYEQANGKAIHELVSELRGAAYKNGYETAIETAAQHVEGQHCVWDNSDFPEEHMLQAIARNIRALLDGRRLHDVV